MKFTSKQDPPCVAEAVAEPPELERGIDGQVGEPQQVDDSHTALGQISGIR